MFRSEQWPRFTDFSNKMALQGKNRLLAVNMLTSVVGFALGLGITFVLTPYVVDKLGTSAYGFIGLSNNLISYTSILTVAVNALSTRFVMVAFHSGDIEKANNYLCSVFFANLAICSVLLLGFSIVDFYLQHLINIPDDLVRDVKILFIMLALSTCCGMLTGILGIGVGLRNQMYRGNIVNMFAGMLRAALIFALFGFLPPKLWYYGLTALVMSIYQIYRNCYFLRTLTPELKIRPSYFNLRDLWEIIKAGSWTIVTRLSGMLSNGFNLLLANLFVSAKAMGVLSIAQTIPGIVMSFMGTLTSNFTPELTRNYASGSKESLSDNLFQSLRICGFISVFPLGIFFAYGNIFYRLWLPNENSNWLYILSCAGTFEMIFAMPLEPLWQVFTITNKIKRPSLNLLYNSICTFVVIFASMYIVKDGDLRILILAATKSAFATFRSVTFLPIYAAKCLALNRGCFHPFVLKSALNLALVISLSILFKVFFMGSGWGSLFIGAVFTVLIGLITSSLIILKKSDREFFLQKFKSVLKVHA